MAKCKNAPLGTFMCIALNCVNNCNKGHHFRARYKTINAILSLSTKIFDSGCVKSGNGLSTKRFDGVVCNVEQRSATKILYALAIKGAQRPSGKIRQSVAVDDVLCHARAVIFYSAIFNP